MTPPPQQPPLRLAYYADDFTGSTDALQVLARAGLRSRLFLAPPTPTQLAEHGPLDAIGVAGRSRSLPTEAIESELRPVFEAIGRLQPRHVHYKVCSTFDSSPTVGSIGRAMEIGAGVFHGEFIPVVVGAPTLGRWCVFGNLFARFGIGSEGDVYRLDRHPAMQNHPVTPANESDLRLQLAQQTDLPVGLLDFTHLDDALDACRTQLHKQLNDGARAVLMDVARPSHLDRIGELLEQSAERSTPLFSVGSSAVETALASQWTGGASCSTTPGIDPLSTPLLVVSGSCSPVTAAQIEHSLAHGFADTPLSVAELLSESDRAAATRLAIDSARDALRAGRSVVVHTSLGPDDPRQSPTKHALANAGMGQYQLALLVGEALGRIAFACRQEGLVDRVCVAGGDTSSYAGRSLRVDSLTMHADFWPGAPICLASSSDSCCDGLQLVFKGGQVGGPDFFSQLAQKATPERGST